MGRGGAGAGSVWRHVSQRSSTSPQAGSSKRGIRISTTRHGEVINTRTDLRSLSPVRCPNCKPKRVLLIGATVMLLLYGHMALEFYGLIDTPRTRLKVDFALLPHDEDLLVDRIAKHVVEHIANRDGGGGGGGGGGISVVHIRGRAISDRRQPRDAESWQRVHGLGLHGLPSPALRTPCYITMPRARV